MRARRSARSDGFAVESERAADEISTVSFGLRARASGFGAAEVVRAVLKNDVFAIEPRRLTSMSAPACGGGDGWVNEGLASSESPSCRPSYRKAGNGFNGDSSGEGMGNSLSGSLPPAAARHEKPPQP